MSRSLYGNDLCDEAIKIARDHLLDGRCCELAGQYVGTYTGQLGLSVTATRVKNMRDRLIDGGGRELRSWLPS